MQMILRIIHQDKQRKVQTVSLKNTDKVRIR